MDDDDLFDNTDTDEVDVERVEPLNWFDFAYLIAAPLVGLIDGVHLMVHGLRDSLHVESRRHDMRRQWARQIAVDVERMTE